MGDFSGPQSPAHGTFGTSREILRALMGRADDPASPCSRRRTAATIEVKE
jgi:hypothetical protein